MRRILSFALILMLVVCLCSCEQKAPGDAVPQSSAPKAETELPGPEEAPEAEVPESPVPEPAPASGEADEAALKIKITVGETELTALLEDNVTTQALLEKMPMTLPMEDLYGRELCYHFGAAALPTEKLRADGYEVGDLIYWPPMGSFVILYKQNGEQFERQQLGHIDSGVEIFENTGDAEVTFERLAD